MSVGRITFGRGQCVTPRRVSLTVELEEKIRQRIRWQAEKRGLVQSMRGAGCPAAQRLYAHIDALQWVLEQAGCRREDIPA